MISVRFYHDTRSMCVGETFPLKLAITVARKTAYISLGVFLRLDQWDNVAACIVKHKDRKSLNEKIQKARYDFLSFIDDFEESHDSSGITAAKLKEYYRYGGLPEKASESKYFFDEYFLSIANSKSDSTKRLYLVTYRRLCQFHKDLHSLKFEDIDKRWLESFDNWLLKFCPSRNSRNIHHRNIRTVFNAAIDDELTTAYPFRKFKMKPQQTRKRALTVEDLRLLFSYNVEPWQEYYRDIFMLSFMLIGINTADLFSLKRVERNGRVEYSRAKTHKLYSVKVEPEAMEIIKRHKGTNTLLDIADRWSKHTTFTEKVNYALKDIGEVSYHGRGHRKEVSPFFPDISMYWARHSWATIAASLDIPKETIAHALGHGCNTVTDIYIDFDERKVDEANRRVLDWVLYGKK